MPPKAQTITDAELGIMKLLWERRTMTAREIRERLYPSGTLSGTPSEHATVQKLLQRLEAKNLIERDRNGFAHLFRANVTQAEIVGEQLQALVQTMADGSMVPVISHLLKQQRLTPEERKQLRKILE